MSYIEFFKNNLKKHPDLVEDNPMGGEAENRIHAMPGENSIRPSFDDGAASINDMTPGCARSYMCLTIQAV